MILASILANKKSYLSSLINFEDKTLILDGVTIPYHRGMIAHSDGDVVAIVAQAPKLAPHITAMRESIAATLETTIDCVNVKATTTEKMGYVGRE